MKIFLSLSDRICPDTNRTRLTGYEIAVNEVCYRLHYFHMFNLGQCFRYFQCYTACP